MNKDRFDSEGIYHVFNRGVDKRTIFMDNGDYSRFFHNLDLFNDTMPAYNVGFKLKSIIDVGDQYKKREEKNRLVDVLAFCLMPNHFHLLLRQRVDGGITKFMRKLGGGYVNYFNLKHKRVGTLFQGKFKSVLIDNDAQLLYIPHYIHLNPLDLSVPEWRDKKLDNKQKAIDYLNSYKWSSYLAYTGSKKFSRIIDISILEEYFGGQNSYIKDFDNFINDLNLSSILDIVLELNVLLMSEINKINNGCG